MDTNSLADRIRRGLGSEEPRGAVICVSGCPNGCAHSRVAHVGLVGGLSGQGDGRHEVYDFFVGGSMGRDRTLSSLIEQGVPADQAAEHVVQIVREPGAE